MEESQSYNIQLVKNQLKLTNEPYGLTYVVLLAVHKQPHRNQMFKINCSRGEPIGSYVRNTEHDYYCISCVDYLTLGYIKSVLHYAEMPQVNDWKVYVPAPVGLLYENMTESQRREYDFFKGRFDSTQYDIQNMQLMSFI